MRFAPGPSIVAAALVCALVLAAPAAAQQSPTLGAPPAPDVTVQSQPGTQTSAGGGGLETWQQALILGAGIILIGGIAVAILSDARERAGRLGHGGPATEPAGASHRHRQQSKQRARAKGKAARAQRRKNR
ncbi:MAG TPA: hypothetical protein VHF51_15375 [Solirubrobacteraceae bacterium]|jgi:hypothetical protein|nr:hypothetical protein [Solirubrobacteraceae bacterium]